MGWQGCGAQGVGMGKGGGHQPESMHYKQKGEVGLRGQARLAWPLWFTVVAHKGHTEQVLAGFGPLAVVCQLLVKQIPGW